MDNDKKIVCPECGNIIHDLNLLRCPRCNKILVKLTCTGSCSKCMEKGDCAGEH